MIILKVFVRQEEVDYIPGLLLAISLLKRNLKYCFLAFLGRFLQMCLAFLGWENFYLVGYFKYPFFIPGLSKIALLSCLVK